MNIMPMHKNFRMPVKSTDQAGAYDLYMPENGIVYYGASEGKQVGLGFAAEVPANHVALLVPRSSKGAKEGISLNNTLGVIDPDYRGEWKVFLRCRNDRAFIWDAGDRVVQMLIVPTAQVELNQVNELSKTSRDKAGFGTTGK